MWCALLRLSTCRPRLGRAERRIRVLSVTAFRQDLTDRINEPQLEHRSEPFSRVPWRCVARVTRLAGGRSFASLIERLANPALLTVDLFGMPNWIEQGPGPITNGNNVLGIPNKPQAGAINAVAVDPKNPDHVFAATVDGGIWRTDNFQAADPTWTPLIDSFPGIATGDIKFDPLDPTGNTIWAGSGNASNDLGDSNPRTGVLKSIDNGSLGDLRRVDFQQLEHFRHCPDNCHRYRHGTRPRWTNCAGRDQWWRVSERRCGHHVGAALRANGLASGSVSDLDADPGSNTRFYAGLPAQFDSMLNLTQSGGVFRGDLAASGTIAWTNVSAGIAGIMTVRNVMIAVHNSPGNNVVNVATVDPTISGGMMTATPFAGVSRSTNQGGTWVLVGGVLPNTNPGKQTGNFSFVADPVDPNITFVSGDRGTSNNAGDIFRVDAGGNSYTSVANGGANNTAPHPDSRFMVFDTNGPNRVLIETNDGGIYRPTIPTAVRPGTRRTATFGPPNSSRSPSTPSTAKFSAGRKTTARRTNCAGQFHLERQHRRRWRRSGRRQHQ